MNQSGGSHQGIDHGAWAPSREAAPLLCDAFVYGKDPKSMVDDDSRKPTLEGRRLPGVPTADRLDPPPNLADHQNAEVDLFGGHLLEPGEQPGIGSSSLANSEMTFVSRRRLTGEPDEPSAAGG